MSTQIPPNPTAQTIAALLPKLHDTDPDYRFMCLNDLFQVLTIGKQDILHNDYNTAAKTVDGILKTLDDQNGEVQNLAIKWHVSPCSAFANLSNVYQPFAVGR
jgi:cullin-associated NEDD8-dissociated protein 1